MKPALIRLLSPAGASLRQGRLRIAGSILLMSVGFALLGSVQALRSDQPVLEPLGVASTLIHWTSDASAPTTTQSEAVGQLLAVLMSVAWVAMALAMATMLVRYRIEAERRGSELGIRRAVGASRTDILAALLVEGGVTALLALAAGATIGWLLLRFAGSQWPGTVTTWPRYTTGVLLVPAIVLIASLSPLRFLRARYLHTYEPGVVPLSLPRFQLAVSLAIVMGSALLIGSGDRASLADVTVQPRSGLVIQIDSGLTENADRADGYGRLLERLRVWNPGAEISLTAPGGLVGLGTTDNVTTDCGQCVRAGIVVPYSHTQAVHLFVSPDSFVAGGARVVAGRVLTEADRLGATRVAVVNRHLALRHFQNGEAVGRRMWLGADLRREAYEVVGIVDDVPSEVLGGALQPRQAVYLSVLQLPPAGVDLLIRADTAVDRSAVEAVIRDSITAGKVTSVMSESGYKARQSRPTVWFGAWFALAGAVVLLTGIGGTMSSVRLWVESLGAEISLRRAVGASRTRIAGFVLAGTIGIAVGGVVLGLFLYFVVVRGTLTAVVRELPVWNAEVFVGLASLLGLIALISSAIPTLELLRRPPVSSEE